MSTPNTKRDQLIAKLKEMFQMDQADLDFGIYRIMNAKRDEVERFLDKDLLPTLRTTLEEFQPAGLADKQKELADAIANARKLKIDPDSLEIVLQLKAELAEGGDLDRLENQVYSDLHTFFCRYYQDGDFLSLRRYKEGVYAMPYEGEEVKLHWANADQYYIKTAENFTRYAFKTAQGRVRFELAAASTERDNNKATADNERRFILAAEPLAMDGDELIIRFEYRPDADKRKQKELSTLAVTSLLALPEGAPLAQGVPQWPAWRAALANALPSDKNKTRTVFEKHLTDYTAKNTFDYFIHKDLGAFLKRELDFFIKNEVMHLDDIEEDSAPRVESYLARIKAMRRISHKLIAFLAQLENFQQRLWLKKKFVLETQWLITLDKVPESFYAEICENAELPVQGWDGQTRSQRQEWVELFAIDEIRGDLAGAESYSEPLTPEFLAANPALVLDTVYFEQALKDRLLSGLKDVTDLDAETDALLVHGENFQALNLLQPRYRGQVRCIAIDPPYNRLGDGFPYKDNYKHSSWLTMMRDRLTLAVPLLRDDGALFSNIDENERDSLQAVLDLTMGRDNRVEELIWAQNTTHSQSPLYSTNHEYVEVYARNKSVAEANEKMFREPKPGYAEIMALISRMNPLYPVPSEVEVEIAELFKTHIEEYKAELRELGLTYNEDTKKQDPWRGLYNYSNVEYRDVAGVFISQKEAREKRAMLRVWRESDPSAPAQKQSTSTRDSNEANFRFYAPIHYITGRECAIPKRGWAWPKTWPDGLRDSFESLDRQGRIAWGKDEKTIPQFKRFLHEVETNVAKSVLHDYTDGEKQLASLFGETGIFPTPKPTTLTRRFVSQTCGNNDLVLDFFGGSGTTGNSVIDANREENGSRKFLLVEAGDHFDSVLLKRIKKVIHAADWQDGKPKRVIAAGRPRGSPQLVKRIRVESYEDTLSNLMHHGRSPAQDSFLNTDRPLRESYMLSYMLDVETRDGLLNLSRFEHPFNTKISVVRSNEVRGVNVDMIETFNYLLGLRVQTMRRIKDVYEVVGVTPAGDQALILWRDVTEVNNDTLDEWFRIQAYSSRDKEFDLIYVNGDNNIENLRRADETWKIRLIEETFLGLMFGTEVA